MQNAPGLVAHRRHDDFNLESLPLSILAGGLKSRNFDLLQIAGCPQSQRQGFFTGVPDQRLDVLASEFLDGITQKLFERGVGITNDSIGIDHQRRLGSDLERRVELAALLLGQAALGDVANHHDNLCLE